MQILVYLRAVQLGRDGETPAECLCGVTLENGSSFKGGGYLRRVTSPGQLRC